MSYSTLSEGFATLLKSRTASLKSEIFIIDGKFPNILGYFRILNITCCSLWNLVPDLAQRKVADILRTSTEKVEYIQLQYHIFEVKINSLIDRVEFLAKIKRFEMLI